MLRHGGTVHGRHHRRVFIGDAAAVAPSAATQNAYTEACDYTYRCMHQGLLITPNEALMLAGTGAREKETLYSIACKFSQDEAVDLQDLLALLGHRFQDYA
ncbi:hypothetical protein [Nibricoccus sp. IMCC34717]|uniref:hypothetical protein n=1 Tax=Nibricoccus sp. IMCC34717 TaxID=3034021 RepID=UPI00384C47B7